MDLGVVELERAFRLLAGHLRLRNAPPVSLVVCGGAALLAGRLRARATQDVDIVALLDDERRLVAPVPFPELLVEAAVDVAETLGLPRDWLNNAPSRDERGLFQKGLPQGLRRRLIRREYGPQLTVFFVGRLDQIHFKLLAAVNAGGRQTDDLVALRPTAAELERAARWASTRDDSPEFRKALRALVAYLGYEETARKT